MEEGEVQAEEFCDYRSLLTLAKEFEESKQLFILTETEQDYNHACAYLKQHLPKLIVKGHYCFEENLQDEQIVNTVNTIAPDIILSILPSTLQEEWIVENSSKVNAKLYVGMGNVVETGCLLLLCYLFC